MKKANQVAIHAVAKRSIVSGTRLSDLVASLPTLAKAEAPGLKAGLAVAVAPAAATHAELAIEHRYVI